MGDKSDTSIAVVGAGIGGMSAALNLLRAGFDVQVYEQARTLREVGAGINVTPNATRIIHDLGLGEKLDNLGVMPLAVRQLRWDDRRTLLHTPLGREIEAHFGFPQYQSHRADVLNMLVTALPAERMHVGHRLIGFMERGDTVEAQFENGARVAVDALIGADGIHSTVQRELFGAAKPRFTGCAAYRGLVPVDKLKHLNFEVTLELSLGPDKHFVRYFVASGRYVNFVAIIEQESWTKESGPTAGT